MKKQQNTESIFFFQIVVYGTCLVLFLGLLATVGVNMMLSHLFLSSVSEPSYIQTFTQVNGLLFWIGLGMIIFFTMFCSTFFRWVQVLSLTKTPMSKKGLFTKFFHTFVSQWGVVFLFVLLCWVGGKFMGSYVYGVITSKMTLPVIPQTSYENRADYYPKQPEPIKFSPPTAVLES
jgi:hypothetical protein